MAVQSARPGHDHHVIMEPGSREGRGPGMRLKAELGVERANALVRKALGDVYRRLGEQWWQSKQSTHVGENMASAFASFAGAARSPK